MCLCHEREIERKSKNLKRHHQGKVRVGDAAHFGVVGAHDGGGVVPGLVVGVGAEHQAGVVLLVEREEETVPRVLRGASHGVVASRRC